MTATTVRSRAIKHLRTTSAWLVAPGIPAEDLQRTRIVLEMMTLLFERNYPSDGAWLEEMTADCAARAVSTAASRTAGKLEGALLSGYVGAMRVFAYEGTTLALDTAAFEVGMDEFVAVVRSMLSRLQAP